MPLIQFLAFDATVAMFWSATYAALGYIFSNQLDRVAAHVAWVGAFVAFAAVFSIRFLHGPEVRPPGNVSCASSISRGSRQNSYEAR
jgi:hypothetical protein